MSGRTFDPENHASASVPPSCIEEHASSDNSRRPVPRSKQRLDGTRERSRAVWAAHYAAADPATFRDDPYRNELSAAIAEGAFTPSFVPLLEARLELGPGELLSGSVAILQTSRWSSQAEVTIFHPRRRRYMSAVVELLTPEDLSEIADVLRLLRSWQPPAAEDGK